MHEDEGCSYLDYGDMPYPEDSMDALEAEQIDAQRTRNKNFHSIFEHLHRAYHDAVFEPREPNSSNRSYSPGPFGPGMRSTFPTGLGGGSSSGGSAGAAAARQSPPPLGGFTTTASFTGAPSSPHHATHAPSLRQRALAAPHRVYTYACVLLRWLGWKVGLAAAPAVQRARSSLSGFDDLSPLANNLCASGEAGAYCGVFRHSPNVETFCSPSASPCPAGASGMASTPSLPQPHPEKEETYESELARLARRFPGERIVTFGREWRVARHMDMQNGHFGLSPLQVWMATRYSRRFAGEVYLMDVVAAGSDPYYPAVRVLDEVVAHAVLYYHNHSLRDFTDDLASELGLEYVPQTVWGRRALGLPIDETEVRELDGLLYTATRRQQDRHRRQQEMRRRQQQQQQREQRARQRKARHRPPETMPFPHSAAATTAAATTTATPAACAKPTKLPSTLPAVTSTSRCGGDGAGARASTSAGGAGATTTAEKAARGEAFVAMEYGNDVDRPTTTSTSNTPKASHTRAAPRTMDSARLSQSAGAEENDDSGDYCDVNTPHHGREEEEEEGGENMQQLSPQQRQHVQHKPSPEQQEGSSSTCAPVKPSSKLLQAAAGCNLVTPIMRKSTSSPSLLPGYSPVLGKAARGGASRSSSSSSDSDTSRANSRGSSRNRRSCPHSGLHKRQRNREQARASANFPGTHQIDPFAGVDENLWIEMQSYDQEEDEEVFYGATAAAVVGIGSGDINMAPHIYDAVMEREVYDERMLLRELDHLKDFLIENRNVLSSAMLTTTGSNALEAVFGVPATVFPFLLCARESVPLVSSIFESLSYHYGALTYDNFSKMTYDAYHVDRPDVLRHTPRLFRMVNKSRRGCITYEELCGWLARKLSCGNNIQPNAHLLAAIMSLRLPLALVAESREDWDHQRCSLKALSDAEDEEY